MSRVTKLTGYELSSYTTDGKVLPCLVGIYFAMVDPECTDELDYEDEIREIMFVFHNGTWINMYRYRMQHMKSVIFSRNDGNYLSTEWLEAKTFDD